MSIYIDINGTWGPADELIVIDDSRWGGQEYDLMGTWDQRTLVQYSERHNYMTPTEWEAEQQKKVTA